MTDENKDKEQEQQEEKPEVKSKKPTKTFTLLLLAFLASLALVLTWFQTMPLEYKSFPSLSNATSLPYVVPRMSIQEDLEVAAAIYITQQGVNPTVFSDFVVYKTPVTCPKTLSLDDTNGNIEGFKTKELKVTNVGNYQIESIVDNASYRLKQLKLRQEKFKQEQKKEIINDIAKFFVTLIPLTLIVFLIFKLFSINTLCRIIIFYIVLIISIISILTALGGQINSTVGKPAIYLYPEKPTAVTITLDKSIALTLDVPTYAPGKGWYVLANPDGKIIDLQPQYTDCNKLDPTQFGMEYAKEACLNNNYPYIYWEADVMKNSIPAQTKGWLVQTAGIKAFLESKLDYVGFNKQEKAEFVRYWKHKISELNQETVFISFMQTEEVEKHFPMSVNPKPDNINRFYIIVDLNVDKHKDPEPQALEKFNREGFTLVDWGGAMIGQDT